MKNDESHVGSSQSTIRIFDTTLRDGEQSPGASMTYEEKLLVAEQLARLGVDIIEAGFPISSPGDLQSVREIAARTKGVAIAGLARLNPMDIDACHAALKDAERPILHLFIATSDLHMQYKLKLTREEVLEQVRAMVAYGRRFFSDIEFSAEDATRTDWNFLTEVYTAAIANGASTINIPDTVGYTMPNEYIALIQHLKNTVEGIDNVAISAHCHDDLGMAVANTLAAISAGATQVEVTINGIGERAGNASLEEVVMALKMRPEIFAGASTNINCEQLVATSHLVSKMTGIAVQPNKAVVGLNAFAHEAGIHQDGVLKHRSTYEIMDPHTVGWSESRLVLGKHSGRHGFDARLRHMGVRLDRHELQKAYNLFIEIVDKRKTIDDNDLHRIVDIVRAPQASVQGEVLA